MTVDIATLGLQVRSDGVVTANDRLRRLQGEGRQAEQSTRRLDQSMRGLSQRARMLRGALATLGVGLSLRGIQNMVTQTAEWSATLVDTAENLGLTTTELQRYRAAARDSTVETSVLDSGLNRLNRRLGEARQGSGQLADVYEELGLQGMDTQEAFDAIADAVANADDASEAARIGYGAFGRQVEDLLPLLRNGSEGIRRMGQDAEDSGRIVDEALVRRGAEAAVSLNRINDALQANIRGGLLAGFADSLGDIEDVMASEEFQSAMDFMGRAIGEIASLAGEATVQIGAMIAMLRDPSMDNLANLGVLGMIRRQIGGAEASEPDAPAETSDEPNFVVDIRRAAHVLPDLEEVFESARVETERYNEALERSEQIGRQSSYAISRGLEDAAFASDSLTDSLANVGEELAKIIMRAQLLEPLGDAIGGGIGGLFSPSAPTGGLDLSTATGIDVSGLDFLNTPGRATGGSVSGGQSYLVGEDGPELLHMGRSGHVQPNHALGGSQTGDLSVRIENYGNDEVTANRETNERGLEELVITVAARDIQSGGKLGRAVNRVTGTTRRGAQR